MLAVEFLRAGVVLVGTVAIGVIVHELSHAVALWLAGVSCKVEFLPVRGGSGRLPTSVRGPPARVTPTRLPEDLSPWHLRVAAMMPFCLALPFGLALAGVVPDPFAVGGRALELATIAWLGCSIPSPQDFSLLWYPERAIATHSKATSR